MMFLAQDLRGTVLRTEYIQSTLDRILYCSLDISAGVPYSFFQLPLLYDATCISPILHTVRIMEF